MATRLASEATVRVRPSVTMVTGAYYPEMSGAGLQCRSLILACGDAVNFSVLTTALDPALPARDTVDGVPVRRVLVSARSRLRRWLATPRLLAACLATERKADIVHLHGFSAKSRLAVMIARLFGARIIVKLTSVGHDDPVSMRAKGRRLFASYCRADRFVGVSPRLAELYGESGLPAERFQLIPNGVDLARFKPAGTGDRTAARIALGLPPAMPIVLFVGFFSHEKCPDLLFDAWTDIRTRTPESTLVFVGRTQSDYYEVDRGIADRIRRDAAQLGLADRVVMVEETSAIEQYYRAADIFVLPSTREGLPNVLLEAMASGLACIASRLPGVTDTLIEDGADGVLVAPGDRAGLASALAAALNDPSARARLGAAARATVERRFSLAATASRYLDLYRSLCVE